MRGAVSGDLLCDSVSEGEGVLDVLCGDVPSIHTAVQVDPAVEGIDEGLVVVAGDELTEWGEAFDDCPGVEYMLVRPADLDAVYAKLMR